MNSQHYLNFLPDERSQDPGCIHEISPPCHHEAPCVVPDVTECSWDKYFLSQHGTYGSQDLAL